MTTRTGAPLESDIDLTETRSLLIRSETGATQSAISRAPGSRAVSAKSESGYGLVLANCFFPGEGRGPVATEARPWSIPHSAQKLGPGLRRGSKETWNERL